MNWVWAGFTAESHCDTNRLSGGTATSALTLPGGCLRAQVVTHTHYLPRHWRGRAHTREVQAAFEGLFQFKALLFLEEMFSIVLTPFVLYFSLPGCAGALCMSCCPSSACGTACVD